MNVAYIHQHFTTPNDFGTLRSYNWSQKLIKAGHSVTMISGLSERSHRTVMPEKPSVITTLVDGITVKFIPTPYSNKQSLVQRALVFRRFATKAYEEILSAHPDLIFASSTPLTVGLPAKKAANKLDVPFIFEVRDLWPELIFALGAMRNPIARYYLTSMELSIYKAARHIIVLSPGMKDGICRTGYDEKNITVIPNCCDLEIFHPGRRTAQEPPYGHLGDVRFVFAGAHGIANGLDAVLDGIAELKKRTVKGVHFLFIGDGSQKERLVHRAKAESLNSYITWLGFMAKTKLADLLPQMDVGLMILKNVPEFYNGTSPNKFFDYIASGLPVLNNYPGWLAGIIKDKKCGLVVQPDNPVDFADKVELLCRSLELRTNMGLAARKLAESEFSSDALGDQFVASLAAVMC